MKTILHEGNQYVLRFDKGEEVMEKLKEFCKNEKIVSAFFQGLGACEYLKLSTYNLEGKKYKDFEFTQVMEIGNLVGDVAMVGGEYAVHMHGTFSDDDLKAIAGHVLSVRVGVTCEMMLTKFDTPMTRKLDPDIGLKLLENI